MGIYVIPKSRFTSPDYRGSITTYSPSDDINNVAHYLPNPPIVCLSLSCDILNTVQNRIVSFLHCIPFLGLYKWIINITDTSYIASIIISLYQGAQRYHGSWLSDNRYLDVQISPAQASRDEQPRRHIISIGLDDCHITCYSCEKPAHLVSWIQRHDETSMTQNTILMMFHPSWSCSMYKISILFYTLMS